MDSFNLPAKDTLFPKPYLPIYPGSWWKYQRLSDSTLFTDHAGGYADAAASFGEYHSKHYFVPTLNGIPHFGYGFDTTNYSLSHGYYGAFTYRLKEEVGSKWDYQLDEGDTRDGFWITTRRTDSVGLTKTEGDTTFTNVIRISEEHMPGGTSGGPAWNYFYYAKDVGLIEWGQTNYYGTTNYPKYRLIDYHINH